MQSPVAAGDKFRKIKANERNHTYRIISEFNADFANFAPLKLNVVQISLGNRLTFFYCKWYNSGGKQNRNTTVRVIIVFASRRIYARIEKRLLLRGKQRS